MIRYLGYSMACDLCFVVFMVSWLITRHFFFVLVIKSTWEARNIIPRIWDPSRGHFMTKEIYFGFFAMLCALQVSFPARVYSIPALLSLTFSP